MKYSANTLSIIIPSFNEEKTIIELLDKVFAVTLPQGIEKEVILIDDASTDRTPYLIIAYIKKNPDYPIEYIRHTLNSGKGKSIRTGLEKVTGKYTVIQDADLEYEPEDYNVLLPCLQKEETKVIYGSRFMGKKQTHADFLFYLGGKMVTWCTNILYNQRLTDEPTCYKMFDTAFLKSIPLVCEGFEFCPEVTAKIAKRGYKIKEVPIHYNSRTDKEGKKIKWKDGVVAIWTLLKYRFKE